jgi:hypothetical protein
MNVMSRLDNDRFSEIFLNIYIQFYMNFRISGHRQAIIQLKYV